MLTLNLKLCLTVSRGGMVYEKPFKDILWSLIFRNCPNYVTEIQFFSDGWNHFFSNQEFNADIDLKLCLTVSRLKNLLKISSNQEFNGDIEPEVVSYS